MDNNGYNKRSCCSSDSFFFRFGFLFFCTGDQPVGELLLILLLLLFFLFFLFLLLSILLLLPGFGMGGADIGFWIKGQEISSVRCLFGGPFLLPAVYTPVSIRTIFAGDMLAGGA